MSLTAAPRTTQFSAFLPPKKNQRKSVSRRRRSERLLVHHSTEDADWAWGSILNVTEQPCAPVYWRRRYHWPQRRRWAKMTQKDSDFPLLPSLPLCTTIYGFFRPPRRVQTETICWEILWSTWIEQEIKWIMLNDFGLMQSEMRTEMRIGPKVSCGPLIPSV